MLANEVNLSLTTPVLRDEDAVFPGENWFFYWKTSASLWKVKLESLVGVNKIYVPINWAFHSDTGDKYDFASERPETDLKKLVDIARECAKEVIFLVPIGPCPFLTNGGLPALLARTPMLDEKGRVVAAVDQEGNLNKLYSFFDPRVYKAYDHFVKALGEYFVTQGIASDIWSMDCCQVTLDYGLVSYLKDHSHVYQQGFSRFLQNKRSEFDESEDPELQNSLDTLDAETEHILHHEFYTMIKSIYLMASQERMSGNWEGEVKVSFLGGGQEDFFKRIHQSDSLVQYGHDLLEGMSLNAITSSSLIPGRLKKGVLGKMLDQLVTHSFVEKHFSKNSFEDESVSQFAPKVYFEVYDLGPEFLPDTIGWADLGLWDYLQKYYSWCYSDMGSNEFSFNEDSHMDRVFFFHGLNMDKGLFHNMLKAFMSGAKIILNRAGLEREFQKKLEAFFIENELDIEKVKLHTTLVNTRLGDGRLLVFNGDDLVDLDEKKAIEFWHRVISTFDLGHLIVIPPEGVQISWKVRSSNTQELQFEEVRRMGIFNPSSYKKKVKFIIPSHFRLLKVVDENKVSFQHGQKEIECELLPEGSLSLDFGVLV
ncbi:MAG: hypothetical protein CME63_03965 [Halobacteriovoraceae bacterium]|nr:hypothetical protein [Halobacteriovoraceae bacterium]MBC96880.1 hypothetical protein [Halobacteriovoraceae bacterium]|tara:strand:- start:179603 stop:181384 length:1782 start_codon:yes stop_codon:yes gene_type:complete